ncbi:putative rhamnogalacturonate lyase C [Pseudocercospora fuligena]|uniref:Putative rhamnogalacturonate lyase C n=1 Tax=Pseudocercospora fuligena TaxID=685502 RepID=A0A8H6VBN9_9PEZI|nr:putative rhamnogalacturonate lyase C [Pseudocercospora fuligena]
MSISKKIRIVCISDTHNAAPGQGFILPKGDILIHAGDLTNQGSLSELQKAVSWISKADFAVKIVIAGNHDLSLDPSYALKHSTGWTVVPADVEACRRLVADGDFVYLQHSSAVVYLPEHNVSLRVFGSPYSPDRGKQNWAFQYGQADADALWNNIPPDIDLLITHTPAFGCCDTSAHWTEGGCEALKRALVSRRPQLHVCGHCHEGRGACVVRWEYAEGECATTPWEDPGAGNKKMSLLNLAGEAGTALESGKETAIVNASIMAKSFGRGAKTFNKPIVVDLLLPIQPIHAMSPETAS